MNRYQRDYDRTYDRNYVGGERYRRSRFDSPHPYGYDGYDRDFRYRSGGYGPPSEHPGFDRWSGDPYGYQYAYDDGYRYGRHGKSRWETDYGDPFADRQHHTPMRMVRREPDWRGRDRWATRYERDYHAWGFPQHYEPYSPESGFHID